MPMNRSNTSMTASTVGWPPFDPPPSYTPPMGGYRPSIRFRNASGAHPWFVHDYQVGSTSNAIGSIAAF
ncbi:hypothetical protein Ahy_A08g037970 isoform B [Arachis hypogaea]|uniref:Uncharacterized protein n=1 Tax=Arachis hypogaea TaxID=3818 RepID=A0A445BS90_ARAHY|nr:hypothetical protein Ahy_A08g037970 isoform B [Arachis hypogaea]